MNTPANAMRLGNDLRILPPRWIYFVLFTISGFSGLIYESIWSHYLKLFLGHAAYAQSLVLIIFMGGMGAGAWLTSRFTARLSIPLLAYVVVEILIGIMGLGFHGVFDSMMTTFYTSILPGVANPFLGGILKWSAAAMLIIPQSILLGMTFPLMSAGILRRYPDTPGGSIAMLYFTNSIGAAVGVLVSGFWLISLFGLPGTIMTAAMLNIGLALTVWVLIRLDPSPRTAPIEARPIADQDQQTSLSSLFLCAAFITGAASFIYEISWIRMLSLVLGSTTHSFELMLSAFITGLAFGGLWIKRRIDSIDNPVNFSGWVQILMAAAALLTLPVYAMSFDWMAGLMNTVQRNDSGFLAFTVGSHVIALAVMLPATFLAGMTLPLFTHVLMKQGGGEQSIGKIYSANTFGAIAGVLFAIHIGLPQLGVKNLVVLGAALDIILGVALIARSKSGRKSWQPVFAAVLACCAVLTAVTTFDLNRNLLISGVYRLGQPDILDDAKVVYYRDGKSATISFSVLATGMASISTNGKPDASMYIGGTNKRTNDEITMMMAGSLPLAYKPDARTIGNIGMGSGLTTHTLLADPYIEYVDTIEIEPAMVVGAQGFGEKIARAFDDPRSRIFTEDAKTFFSLHNKRYDIIVAEPSNPWVSGVSSLFSGEFYRMVRNYMVDDGIFVQWLQLYEFNDDLVFSVLKALSPNFDDYVIYNTDNIDILIIAKKNGELSEPDFSRIMNGQMAADLNRIDLRSEHDLLVRKTARKDTIEALFPYYDVPANSDYFPYLDLNAGKARFKREFVKLMTDWGAAPVPMLEMLHIDDLQLSATRRDSSFARLEAVGTAQTIFNELVAQDPNFGQSSLPSDVYLALQSVNLMRSDCSMTGNEANWQYAWFQIAQASLAYLDPAQAEQLVAAAYPEDCRTNARTQTVNWLNFYQAVASRNADSMANSGTRLLNSEAAFEPDKLQFVIAATMLGHVQKGNYADAVSIWRSHAEPVQLQAAPYTNLILQIASAHDS